VYVPAGSGFAIATAIEDHLPETLLAGFVGYAEGEQRGLVIDRVHKLDHAPDYAKRNWQITSIDEFAVIMGKHSAHEIDPALGWHLWATDLCIEASKHLYTKKLDIKHIPLFHNSLTESSVSGEYEASREVFKEKHKGYGTVKTLADTFEA
jgi:hypothetical protein